MNPLLDVKNLYVRFKTPDGTVTAVNDLNFTLNAGSTLGIVGESGSGKSQTAFALMGLLAANGTVEGSAIFEGKELVNLPKAELNKIRAEQISMIFQDPMTSLNPYMKIGENVGCGQNAGSEKTHGHVSTRVFRRYASTGDDCDGLIMPSKTTHCR